MTHLFASCLLALTCSLTLCADPLRQAFDAPPKSTEPFMYWYWLNNNVSAKGITADLEAMRQAGVGEACASACSTGPAGASPAARG